MDSRRDIPTIMLNRNALATGSAAMLRSGVKRGEYVRLRSGAYIAADDFDATSEDERYRHLVHATAASMRRPLVFSHDSAAVLWGLPTIGPWPRRVHVLAPRASGGRSHSDIRRHCVGQDANATTIDGLRVTSLARTLVDVACSSTFLRAVAMIDAGLSMPAKGDIRWNLGNARTEPEELQLALQQMLPCAGSVRAAKAIEFGDGRSGSPLESLSRVQMLLLGVPAPALQVPFWDEEGHIGDADFYWPHLGLVGECDGKVKYAGAEHAPSGKAGELVAWEEKRREDRMRAVVKGFVRWDWDTAYSRPRFAARMRRHGLLP